MHSQRGRGLQRAGFRRYREGDLKQILSPTIHSDGESCVKVREATTWIRTFKALPIARQYEEH